ncbi:MAG: hypothetical protein AAGJ87_07445 [Pseudomonadota bacterium]
MTAIVRNAAPLNLRSFVMTFLFVSLWINASEIVRYFGVVMPMVRESFSALDNPAPMNVGVFAVWAVWMSVLVGMLIFFYWLYANRFGASVKSAVVAGSLCWLFFFFLFWVGVVNMGLGTIETAAIALPWAWAELVIGALIARWSFSRF